MTAALLLAATAPQLSDTVMSVLQFIGLIGGAAAIVAIAVGALLSQFRRTKKDETDELIRALQGRTDLQEKELIELRARVTQLETTHAAEIAVKDAEINRQKGEIATMRAENDRLRARNGDLEIRVDRISELNATLSRRTRATDTTLYQGPERREGQDGLPAEESEVPRVI